ncbi:MAG: RagB/SusD family nutrient uptake outer membrane protein [Paludibacter sp.]|nr:RagB/SusD family nutrient uptake outer membrane protein [Paludibacter sp.]
MKLFKYIPLLFLFTLYSCDLNLQPISEIGEGSFYQTTDEINSAVIACYNGLQAPLEFEWMLTELRSDNSRLYNTATTSSNNTLLFEFDQAKVSATNTRVYDYWQTVYHNIARCNTVLDPDHLAVVTTDSLRNQYEGEAKFIRAYHYFNLVRLFGPVFIITERISAEEAKQYDRSSVEDVYALIESDLKDAIDKLPSEYSDDEKGRVTSWAAKALLAKVYMTEGLIDETTQALLKDVYENSGYRLMDTYESVFDINNEVNDEILFTVRFTSGGLGLGSIFGNRFAPQLSGSSVINGDGSGYNYPSSDLVQAYNSSDTREDVTIALNYVNDNNQVIDRRYIKKYLSPVTIKDDGDKDWPILRFADVILLYAEVENELDGVAAALPLINETRTRAGLTELKESSLPNKHSMRMAIEKERRLELAFENQRWFDLVRTGRAIEVMNEHYSTEEYYESTSGAGPLNDNNILLPIPQKEIDINPNISQNMGY